jgi:hypothetical protein
VHQSRTVNAVQDCGIHFGSSVSYWVGCFAEFVLGVETEGEVRRKGLQRRKGKIGVMDFSRGSN